MITVNACHNTNCRNNDDGQCQCVFGVEIDSFGRCSERMDEEGEVMDNQEAIEILLNEQKCLDRNDGVQCDRKCESCDLVMDAETETIREAYSMAISALQAQDLQPTCNKLATDTISRTATIGAIVNTVSEIGLHDNSEVARYGATFRQHEIIDIIKGIPSAQPNLQPTCNQLATDVISRQSAIDALMALLGRVPTNAIRAKDALERLPSAQPEWNNHTVACLLADLFGDSCACNYNGIDEWLPEKCELLDSCPNTVGVACWEQYLKHREERRTDD